MRRMGSGKNRRWLRLVVLTAALTAILLVASGASLWHIDAPGSEATCTICHLAHLPALAGVLTSAPVVPALVAWIAPAETQVAHLAPAALSSPPALLRPNPPNTLG